MLFWKCSIFFQTLSLKLSQAAESEQRTHSCSSSSLVWLWGSSLLFVFTLLPLICFSPPPEICHLSMTSCSALYLSETVTCQKVYYCLKSNISHLLGSNHRQQQNVLLMFGTSVFYWRWPEFQRSQSWLVINRLAPHMFDYKPVHFMCV